MAEQRSPEYSAQSSDQENNNKWVTRSNSGDRTTKNILPYPKISGTSNG